MEILLFWIFLPAGVVEILLLRIFLPTGYGNSVALDISAGWGMEILLLIKSFDRLGDLIYMVL